VVLKKAGEDLGKCVKNKKKKNIESKEEKKKNLFLILWVK